MVHFRGGGGFPRPPGIIRVNGVWRVSSIGCPNGNLVIRTGEVRIGQVRVN